MKPTELADPISAALLLDRTVLQDPYPFYRRLVKEAPVWKVPGTSIVVVSGFDAVTEAAGRTAEFSSHLRGLLVRGEGNLPEVFPFYAGPGTDVLATADPPIHSKHRSAVFPELVSRRMTALRPEVEEIAHPRVDRIATGSHSEVMSELANAVPIRVVSRLIGWENEDPEVLFAAALDSTANVRATGTQEELLESMVRASEIMGWITEQLDDAVANGAEGILGATAEAVRSGDLEKLEGIVILHTLLSAGGESTTSFMGNAIHMLALDPDLQQELRGEPGLITPFIEEVLRLESPFRYHLRHAPNDCELNGIEVEAGATVLLLWAAANRDPAEYDDPDSVRLDRAASRHHLGFGRGIHLCVGAPLARLEAEVVLSRLLERTSSISLDPDVPLVCEYSLVVRRFEQLGILTTSS